MEDRGWRMESWRVGKLQIESGRSLKFSALLIFAVCNFQLSILYPPSSILHPLSTIRNLATPAGLEPATSCFVDRRSGPSELRSHLLTLRGRGSNSRLRIPSAACCRLHHPAISGRSPNRTGVYRSS